jgi:CRP/FNR family transcriptional regulator, cyclic AMP receptor protein
MLQMSLSERSDMQTLDPLENLIKEHPFLAGLSSEFCEFLCECASLRRFASHQQIFQEGGEADHFYLILTGAVSLETVVPGRGIITIQSLGPGEALGWSWLFPPYEWQFTATTRAPTEVISFDASALRAKAAGDRDFRDELLTRVAKTLFQRLQATRIQLTDAYSNRS